MTNYTTVGRCKHCEGGDLWSGSNVFLWTRGGTAGVTNDAVVCMDSNGVLLATWNFAAVNLTNIWNVASIASNHVILLDQEASGGTQILASVYLGAAGAYSLEWASNLPRSIGALYSQDGFGLNGKA